MEIRVFSEDDRKAVLRLWEACGLTRPWNDPNKDIDRKIQFQPELFFIGESETRIIASAMAGYDGHRGSAFYLGVHPEFQGKGFGQKMMLHIEELLGKMGCPKLNILVRGSNSLVLDFYASAAYTKDDVVNMGKRIIADD